MTQTEQDLQQIYRFIRLEEFFSGYQQWSTLDTVISHSFDVAAKTLSLNFRRSDGAPCVVLIQLLRDDIVRLRFNPTKGSLKDYTVQNTRAVVMDTVDELRQELDDFSVALSEASAAGGKLVTLVTRRPDLAHPTMQIQVSYSPFQVSVLNYEQDQPFPVWRSVTPGIYYTPNGDEDYAIIQAIQKPATARYIGFGEQGGKELCKNTDQLSYFNYDNYVYNNIYGRGALDNREPLYHSDPFFMEFNGAPDRQSVYGLFVDNPSQQYMDIGYLNTSRYLLGTRFGTLDYYFLLGHSAGDVLDAFSAIIGKPKLYPRYVLGYHQGCYGYEDADALRWAAGKYRQHGFPLDGLHIDVDIQHNYQTFTINQDRFPNPQQMFADLRAQGVKCSTNITPIISNQDQGYQTYREGLQNDYFVNDRRYAPDDPSGWRYQAYGGGVEYHNPMNDSEKNFNSGNPYIGEVNYGGTLGTTGHYPDLGRSEVRRWWGSQYQYLFDMGLEMVWQDMTTPAVRETRGDMKGFPFRLYVTDDHLAGAAPKLNQAIKIWSLFSYNLHKATYYGLNELKGRENKRNFIIGRGSYTGMHRFAGLWTGDNASNWDFLRINIAQVLSLGISGQPVCGQDIGGFATSPSEPGQQWVGPELLIRWTAAGAFLPWFRNHYVRKGQKQFQEPFQYQDWFAEHGQPLPDPLYSQVIPICKHYIELRYRLMQLFYDAMFESVLTGLPICRPMFLTDPSDKALYNDKLSFLDNQFLVRGDLLIAPIVEPQSSCQGQRDIYLPAGSSWYQFMDNRSPLLAPVDGGTTVRDYEGYLDSSAGHIGFIVPMYVRAGAIIPTLELEQYVGERNANGQPNPLTLNIYPGQRGAYTLYLDDGVSRSSAPKQTAQYKFGQDKYANSEYRETRIMHSYSAAKTRQISVERIHEGYTPQHENFFYVALLHDPAEKQGTNGPLKKLSVAGQALKPLSGGSVDQRANTLSAADTNAWYYNENINISFVKVFDGDPAIVIEIQYT